MSRAITDVTACFRPALEEQDVVLLTHRVLQDFPRRSPPEFRPWFPSGADTGRVLRPRKAPPRLQAGPGTGSEPFLRSWCVEPKRAAPPELTHFTRDFSRSIERHGLHLHQRVRWVLSRSSCGRLQQEELWVRLNRAIRHARLPTCNANFQRARAEIWVYCDLFCCQRVGRFLKRELQLPGRISLCTHRLQDLLLL